jgi:hypothetical protein
MLRPLAIPFVAATLLTVIPPAGALAKPCAGRTAVPALEEMLPRARVALDLPGTDQVAVDGASRCIGIQVRTKGTARLVKLTLRGVDVPREDVEIRVVEPAR